jgi:hypothetical protein
LKRADDPLPPTMNLTDISCDWIVENAPAYALDALDPVETESFERHLLLCQSCEAETQALARVSALLGAGVELYEPPASIKQNLLAAIRTPSPQGTSTLSLAPARQATPSPVSPNLSPIPQRSWLSGRLIVTPLLAACLLIAFWGIDTQRQLDSTTGDVARLERENDALTVQLSSIQAGQLAYGSTGIWYPLRNAGENTEGAGGIVMSGPTTTVTLLSVWNMPQEHDSYHVICESKRGELLAAGEIQVNERGTGTVTLTLPAPVTEYRAVHVVPNGAMPNNVADLTNDILRLLLGEPTAIATGES